VPKKIILKPEKDYSRIDHFLNESFPSLSRSKIEKLIKDNRVMINAKTVTRKNTVARIHDLVEVEYPESDFYDYQIQRAGDTKEMDLIRLFEDEYLVVIDKPAGITVHPGAGRPQTTILDIFRSRYPQIEKMKDTERPGIVHRLDRDTSGILILAKDQTTMKHMQKKFKEKEIKKEYRALIQGKMRYKNGSIDSPITRHGKYRKKFTVIRQNHTGKSREAITEYSVLLEFNDTSYIRLIPLTGRTHQLRVHLSYYGNPILGDPVYGKALSFKRLALHATKVEFFHPVSGNFITVNSSLPECLRKYIQTEIPKKTSIH
jgi:23S rRNA pseudouridine1911/1915/1917 synthase